MESVGCNAGVSGSSPLANVILPALVEMPARLVRVVRAVGNGRPPTIQSSAQSKPVVSGSNCTTVSRTVATATTRITTTRAPVASSSLPLLSIEEIIAAFKEPAKISSHIISELLRHLCSSPAELGISLFQPGSSVATTTTPKPSSSRDVLHLAKEIVNATHAASGQLYTNGWRHDQPSSDLPPAKVYALFDGYRIAIRVIFSVKRHSPQRSHQVLLIALSQLKRIAALGLAAQVIPAEAAFLQRQILADSASNTQHLLWLPTTGIHAEIALDYLITVLSYLLPTEASVSETEGLLAAINDPTGGPQAWSRTEDAVSDKVQKLPLVVERCLSRWSQELAARKETPIETIFELRRAAVLWLLSGQDEGAEARRTHVAQRIERMAVSYWKEAGVDPESRQTAWRKVDAALREIEQRVTALHRPWTETKEWAGVVEVWKKLAVKNADTDVLWRLSNAGGSGPSLSDSVAQTLNACSNAIHSIDALDGAADPSASLQAASPILFNAALALQSLSGADAVTISRDEREQLCHILDRLRRRCCSKLDHVTQGPIMRNLLQAVLEMHVGEETNAATIASTASGHRALALALFDAGHEDEALDWLRRGRACLADAAAVTGHAFTIAEQLELLSRTLYHAGARVYSARKYAIAAQFIESAAESIEKAAELAPQSLSESLHKWWGYIAACHRQLGQPHEALRALRNSLRCTPSEHWQQVELLARTEAPQEAWAHASLEPLARTLRSMFEVCTFELLGDQDGKESMAVVLEATSASAHAQVLCLEHIVTSSWLEDRMYVEGAATAANALIRRAVELVDEQSHPICKARLLLHAQQQAMLRGDPPAEGNGVIARLLSRADLKQDAKLARHVGPLLVVHRLLNVLSHQGSDVAILAQATKAAIEAVRNLHQPGSKPFRARMAESTVRTTVAKTPRIMVTKTPVKSTVGVEIRPTVPRVLSLLTLTTQFLAAYGQTLKNIELLELLRRITDAGDDEKWVRTSVELARQYIILGKHAHASRILEAANKRAAQISSEERIQVLILRVHLQPKIETYEEVLDAVTAVRQKDTTGECGSGVGKALDKIAAYRLVSATADAYSCVALARDDATQAIEGALHAASYAVRAATLLAKVTRHHSGSDGSDGSDGNDDLGLGSTQSTSAPCEHRLSSLKVASVHWQLNRELLARYQRLSHLYHLRGSAKDAEGFATEAVDLAEGLGLSLTWSQSLLLRADIRLQLHKGTTAEEDVAKALQVLNDVRMPEAAALACLQGDQLARDAEKYEDAIRAYSTGEKTLRALEEAYAEVERVLPSPRPSERPSSPGSSLRGGDGLLPELRCRLLRRQAWLLQTLGRAGETHELLERASTIELVNASGATAEHHLIEGRMTLQASLQAMESHAVWGMVSESAISLPLASHSGHSGGDSTRRTVASLLQKAEAAFGQVVAMPGRCSAISLRRAMEELSLTTAYLSLFSVKTLTTRSILDTARTLDGAAAVTLHREALQAIHTKLETVVDDNGPWLRLPTKSGGGGIAAAAAAAAAPSAKPPAPRTAPLLTKGANAVARSFSPATAADDDEDDDSKDPTAAIMRRYWEDKRAGKATTRQLPANWTVISIAASRERNSLLVTRRSGSPSLAPVVFVLPIDRQTRREGEDVEDVLSLDAALEELSDIVTSSNQLTSSARTVSASSNMEQRKEWWMRRRDLDERMRTLCEGVEQRWLGAFKSVFLDPLPVGKDSPALASFRRAFEVLVQRMCYPAGIKRASNTLDLDEAIFQCVAGLVPSATTDEELEDLLHFVMDAHQFSGVPIAIDEADLDMLAIDMRSALEDFRSACARECAGASSGTGGVRHIFLVLDKDTAPLPWESIPALRRRPVCRIPSLDFLLDRVEMVHRLGATQDDDGALHLPRDCKAWYLLNPSRDLVKSQARFEGYLSSKKHWRGIVGRPPADNDFVDSLGSQPLVLYFGHSGAEQFVRASKIRALSRCAVTMLWGCSSALLRDQGDFDRTGTPYNYMLAGAPAMVGQLFDATDKELDSISESVLMGVGLKEEASEELQAARRGKVGGSGDVERCEGRRVSLAQAVAESRDSCRLPYLSGAAPVVWGIPVYFDRDQ